MITKCWIIENSAASAKAVKLIEDTFPCFTFFELLETGEIEFTISCRIEDIVTVQSIISPHI
jgi:hypothetical protein